MEGVFRFKQFELRNEISAMRVGTDGVLLGAWAPAVDGRVLDVGAGTGLLSLMMAQRSTGAEITGIELDKAAAAEARANAAASPWAERIHIVNADVAEWTPDGFYDLIISNPPFFKQSLLPEGEARTAARHETALSIPFLMRLASRYLTADGRLALVVPTERDADVEYEAALARLEPIRHTAVVTSPRKGAKRSLWLIARAPSASAPVCDTLIMRNADGSLSDEYKTLTSEFYL